MWIIWDGRMLNYGLAGRSQNVLFNLYLIDIKIEYTKNNILYSDPLPDLRSDLEASRYSAFAYIFGFFEIPNNHRVMVSCSLVGARVGLLIIYFVCSPAPAGSYSTRTKRI
jgi:hypothetical protein